MTASDWKRRMLRKAIVLPTCGLLLLAGLTPAALSFADELTDPYEADIDWFLDDQRASSYDIYGAAELYGLAQLVNGTAVNPYTGDRIPAQSFKGVSFHQKENLTLAKPSRTQEWTPIGNARHSFSGTYDGEGHSVRGITITSTTSYAGFFGHTSASSTIENLDMTSSSLYSSSVSISTSTERVAYIGSLVGYAGGVVQDCTSRVPVTVASETPTTKSMQTVLTGVGGLAGQVNGNLSGCSYRGSGAALTVTVAASSYGENLQVCDSIGGLVGHYGEPDDHGEINNCYNAADVWATTTGAGAEDRFGITTYARPYFVGGLCGYTNGSIRNSYNGSFDSLYGRTKGMVQTSATEQIGGTPLENRGGDEVGGLVGSVRGESNESGRYNDGDPDDKTYIENCYNLGEVVGCCAVGGVCGQMGVYCYLTQCYNGESGDEDIGHVVSTRWNKPCAGGVLGQGRGAAVSFCANYALVENVQTGYYTSGIVGVLWASDDYPSYQPEMRACFNSGHVYTANREVGAEYRESGICGSNEGYVHDCVMLYGTVPYHDNSPIGANNWGLTANLSVLSMEEMQTSYCASLLNASNLGSWDVYWYMNNDGYPVLNVWEGPDSVEELSASNIASVSILQQATYLGSSTEPVPTLSVTLTSGRVLWQNTDFYVLPQKGAVEVTRDTEAPYSASIVGLGRFSGQVDNVCKYGIGKGDLANATVAAAQGKYSNGNAAYPSDLRLIMGGAEIDSSNFSYRIYDYKTESLEKAGAHYVVYDSEGYAVFSGSSEYVPISQAKLTGDYVLYDRDRAKISDSDGNVYNPRTGSKVSGTYACSICKTGSNSGYLVEVMAKSSAIKFTGTAIGRYSVTAASLKDDVSIDSITCEGQTWYWDKDSAMLYSLDGQGEVDPQGPRVTFTGKQIVPRFKISYLDKELVEGEDYELIYGDPQAEFASSDANVCVTTDDNANGFTIRSADSARFSNYLPATFKIEPARFEDCKISLDETEYSFTGKYIEPKVSVTLNGVELKAGRDYKIEYKNNLYQGTASYTVTALDNLKGGKETSCTGTFTINAGTDIAQYSLDKVTGVVYNFGKAPLVKPVFRNADDELISLVKGKDYDLSFSSTALGTSTLTVSGIGKYRGSITQQISILSLNVEQDPWHQVEVSYQDITYGTWKPDYDSLLPRYNIAATCPAASVKMYAVVDWGNESNGWTPVLADEPYTARSSSLIVGTIGAYYFDSAGKEVNYKTAQPGTLSIEVRFSKTQASSSGAQYGCTGTLKGTAEYLAPADISSDVDWQLTGESRYSGSEQRPVVGYNKGTGNKLTEGTDYTISYRDNVDVGIAEYTVSAVEGSRYTGSYTSTFPIVALDLTTQCQVRRIGNQQYTGFDIEPKPVVKVGDKTLVEGTDYTLAYMHNKVVGTARCYITGMGNYGGRTSVTFKIVGDISAITDDCIAAIPDQEYTGGLITPALDVVVDAKRLVKGRDYLVSFKDNKALGKASVTVEGIGSYNGVASASFTIVKASLASATVKLSASSFTYDGKAKRPGVTVKKAGRTLKAGADYAVSYSKNTAIGTAKVTIAAKGMCTGSASATFKIVPAGTKVVRIVAGRKMLALSWNKQSVQTTGYQLRWSLKKKMPKKKTGTALVKKVKTTSGTISKLKAKKKYYVQVRTYKKIGKTYYWSAWSKRVAKKTK